MTEKMDGRIGRLLHTALAMLTSVLLLGMAAPRANPTSQAIRIVATDYAFQAPAELPAGRVTFVLENRGKVRHELNMALLNPGIPIDRLITAIKARQGGQQRLRTAVGILIARPGHSSDGGLSTTLLPGRDYAIVCTFSDSVAAPQHLNFGMYGIIHIVSTGATSNAEPPADTIVGMDYSYRAPATLPAGIHRFAFRNAGRVRHEADIILLAKGVNAESALASRRKGADIDSLFESGIGVLISPPGTSPLGTLETTLLAGRDYLITCGFQDNPPASPRHYVLGMDAVIHVTTRTR